MASEECPRQAITPWKSFIPECTSTSGPGQPGTRFISTGPQRAQAPVGTAWRSALSQEHRAGCAAGSACVYRGPSESPMGQTDRPVLVELGRVPTRKAGAQWKPGPGRKAVLAPAGEVCRRGLQTEGSRASGQAGLGTERRWSGPGTHWMVRERARRHGSAGPCSVPSARSLRCREYIQDHEAWSRPERL